MPAGKEADSETGLYYFGARYLDPKTARWISGDPAVSKFIPVVPINDEAKEHNQSLPGMGGVFNYINLHVYHYAGNNPIVIIDPDGELNKTKLFFGIIQTVGGTVELIGGLAGAAPSGGVSLFLVVHGIGNIGDGIIAIAAAATDNEWGGVVYGVSKEILSNVTDWSENTVEAASNGAAFVEGVLSMGVTHGMNLGKIMQKGGKPVSGAATGMSAVGAGKDLYYTAVSGYQAVTNTSNQSEPSNDSSQASNINQEEQ